jgi:hypothetical protein
MCSIYKWDDNQYIFCRREFGIPVSTVFFYDWHQMRSTGKFFSVKNEGVSANSPAGALINKFRWRSIPPMPSRFGMAVEARCSVPLNPLKKNLMKPGFTNVVVCFMPVGIPRKACYRSRKY